MPNPTPVADEQTAQALLAVVRETLLDLNRETPRGMRVTLDSSFDRDLALDSLARVELLLRVERRFGVSLPENTLQQAETPRDLLAALAAGLQGEGLTPGQAVAIMLPTSPQYFHAYFGMRTQPC